MKNLILSFLLAFPVFVMAQSGNYFLYHHAQSQKHSNSVCFDMAQDKRGVMYFATNGGVLEFDGKNWDILKGPNQVYALHVNANGDIYWGGAKGYGIISLNAQGFQQLNILSDTVQADILQIISVKDNVYFLSNETLFTYNHVTKKETKIQASLANGSFTSVFELFGIVYLNTADEGLFKVDGNKLTRSKLSLSGDVVFFSRIEDDYVVATSDNKLWVVNESLQLKAIPVEDEKYLNASAIINGSWVNKQLLAVGTLRGGVVFLNPITGRTLEIVNYATGLPDNEVFALIPDQNQNVWIAHDYGFTRVSPYMPFRTFSHYPGLEGNPLCAFSHAGSVYAGTSVGLFKLERENVYDELVYYVNVEVKQQPAKQTKTKVKDQSVTAAQNDQPKAETESKKRGVFGFLKKNKNKTATTSVATATSEKTDDPVETASPSAPVYRREKRTERVLRSSQFSYKKVKGIDAKITSLLEVDGKLVASGLGGIYQVTGVEAKMIQEEPVRYLYAAGEILFASTYDDKITVLTADKGSWHQINSLNNIEDQITYMFEGQPGELWLCGLDQIYQIQFSKEQISINRKLSLENPDMETTVGVSWNDQVLFTNSDGFYQFLRKENKIAKVDSLPEPAQYFPHDGSILYRNEHGWNLVGQQNSKGNLQLLNLFHDLRFISTDQEPGNLWVISRDNELYKFYGDKVPPNEVVFPLFLKTIINNDQRTALANLIHISEDKSAVRFEIVQPDFISPEAVEFRYQLEGMNAARWSSWSGNNNIIDFPYLPPGDYTLLVQSKNIFGKIAELEPMKFEVLPPYWKRPWFFAMEFAVLATMVLLSFRLNSRYQIVSRLLSLLTIILLIEFIQTLINSTIQIGKDSPVLDFISQVFIALLILPVEGYLRNLMFRSMDPSSRIYQLVNFKTAGQAQHVEEEFEISDKEHK
jgi:hypothetical protein